MKRFGIGLAVWGSVLALSLPVVAEEGKSPLPQLDANLYPGQLFWLAIAFPLFFLLMRFLAVPLVQRTQGDRRQVLGADLQAAETDNEQARIMQEAYEKALLEARTTAKATVSSMAEAAAHEDIERRTAQQHELSRRIAEAEARLAEVRETALKDAKKAAGDLATAMVEKLLGKTAGARR